MATWPVSLPDPILNSYHSADVFPVLKTEMQSGPPRRTRYSDHYLTTGQLTMVVNSTQAGTFQQLLDDSNLGTDWITGCPIDTGTGLKNHRIRITSVQRKVLTPPDQHFQITVSFETDEHL